MKLEIAALGAFALNLGALVFWFAFKRGAKAPVKEVLQVHEPAQVVVAKLAADIAPIPIAEQKPARAPRRKSMTWE